MSIVRKSRRTGLLIAALPIGLLAALGLAIFFMSGSGGHGGGKVQAATDSAVDFSISTTGCDSSGTPTSTCSVDAGATFTLALNLNHLPSNGSYNGYDSKIDYTSGLTTGASGLHQNGTGNWPDCAFNASDFSTSGIVVAGCTIGIGAASSTYTGALSHLDFTCPASPSAETITLVSGDTNTDTVDANFVPYSEAADESLTISCGGAAVTPTDTPTPCVDCPTPTETPIPPTPPPPTPTPAGLCGDANGDGSVNSLDAFFVLQFDAGLITSVPHPENSDTNHDGSINSLDALIILQINAGLLSGC